jgi:hypothetical protein
MSTYSRRIHRGLISIALLLIPAAHLGAGEASPAPGTYQIVDGKVDWGTFAGWFVFHMSCQTCHGKDVVATGAAPNLRQSLKVMTLEKFSNKVLARYRLSIPSADATSNEVLRQSIIDELVGNERSERYKLKMPAWPDDGGIEPHIPNLYAYLKARSDDAIGTGRPATLDP